MNRGDLILNCTMSEFDTGLPSIRQVQEYVKDKKEVEIKLSTDDLMVGRIIWQDQNCLCLVDHYENPALIWRQALVYLKPKA
jgi:host factor-I protein